MSTLRLDDLHSDCWSLLWISPQRDGGVKTDKGSEWLEGTRCLNMFRTGDGEEQGSGFVGGYELLSWDETEAKPWGESYRTGAFLCVGVWERRKLCLSLDNIISSRVSANTHSPCPFQKWDVGKYWKEGSGRRPRFFALGPICTCPPVLVPILCLLLSIAMDFDFHVEKQAVFSCSNLNYAASSAYIWRYSHQCCFNIKCFLNVYSCIFYTSAPYMEVLTLSDNDKKK